MNITVAGKLLKVPKGAVPLPDKSRLQVFEMLGPNRIKDSKVLDLYAGSGSNGIEALVQGAAKVIFVDITIDASECIASNLHKFNLTSRGIIEAKTVEDFMRNTILKYDIIFIDPPLPQHYHRSFEGIHAKLEPDGIVVYRHIGTSNIPPTNGLKIIDRRKLVTGGEVVFLNRKA